MSGHCLRYALRGVCRDESLQKCSRPTNTALARPLRATINPGHLTTILRYVPVLVEKELFARRGERKPHHCPERRGVGTINYTRLPKRSEQRWEAHKLDKVSRWQGEGEITERPLIY